MKQYNEIKAEYPDAILLFRVGDFYETFGEDAVKASTALGIVLTRRFNGSAGDTELAGFPCHSLETYLPRLVRAGHRVAVCDQLEDPKLAKKIVRRGVTEVVTPGVTFSENVLDSGKNNFLAAIHFGKSETGLSFIDVSTGEFFLVQCNAGEALRLLQTYRPSEVLYAKGFERQLEETGWKAASFAMDDWVFATEYAREKLMRQFGTAGLKGFGIDALNEGIVAAGVVLEYLSSTRNDRLAHIAGIKRIDSGEFVGLDNFTIRNLELLHSPGGGKSLIDILNTCASPMGSRLMRKWLIMPLKDLKLIGERHDSVDAFLGRSAEAEELRNEISKIGDLERLITRLSVNKVNPREVLQLSRSLESIGRIRLMIPAFNCPSLTRLCADLDPCLEYAERISREIDPDTPAVLSRGGVIAGGVNSELDELRKLQKEGRKYLLDLQQRESERTGIGSLKIAYNSVFGYYIEVRNTHKDKVPVEWIRKQTLVSAERYITSELKEYEEKILGAGEKIAGIEAHQFNDLVAGAIHYISRIQNDAAAIASLDCLLSFAGLASSHQYTRPVLDDSLVIDIGDGRHPVIEQMLEEGRQYIANDIYLDCDNNQILVITGPNMAGKSALLRQTALIVLLAHIGSFVPASRARIGLTDKIFTRVGGGDNISGGESTFMVEMNETASILNNITARSLILLDEIGRGTSTFDGISIAWSIAEYLHEHPKFRPKTLFATHYHEMNEMEARFSRIKNFKVAVRETENGVIFIRKLKPGGSEHSFGIHVARMAGMPPSLVKRAEEVLKSLESSHIQSDIQSKERSVEKNQLNIFATSDPLADQLIREVSKVEINNMTPIQALQKLDELTRITQQNKQ